MRVGCVDILLEPGWQELTSGSSSYLTFHLLPTFLTAERDVIFLVSRDLLRTTLLQRLAITTNTICFYISFNLLPDTHLFLGKSRIDEAGEKKERKKMSGENQDHIKTSQIDDQQEEQQEGQPQGLARTSSLYLLLTSSHHSSKKKKTPTKSMTSPGGLAAIGDPLGNALGTGLRPLGKTVETITKPISDGVGGATRPFLGPVAGEKHERAEIIGGDNKDSYVHGKDSIGGKVQTGDNPLGLDQTGKWGFRDEN